MTILPMLRQLMNLVLNAPICEYFSVYETRNAADTDFAHFVRYGDNCANHVTGPFGSTHVPLESPVAFCESVLFATV